MTVRRVALLLLLLITAPFVPAAAQQDTSTEELAKKTQNPVADLISVPLQNDWNFGAGYNHNKTIYVLNIQPVIPINDVNGEWNVITSGNWKADKAGDVWTVPQGGSVGKLFRLGQILPLQGHPIAKLPINTQLTAYGNVHDPESGPDWQLRFQVQVLFPK